MPAHAHALATQFSAAARTSGTTASYPIPEADGVTIDKERELILVRWQATVYAFRLSCPHQKAALKWKEKDGRFQCPKHKSRYEPDGKFISGRATRSMDRYAIARRGNEIVVDTAIVYLEDKDATLWAGAGVKI